MCLLSIPDSMGMLTVFDVFRRRAVICTCVDMFLYIISVQICVDITPCRVRRTLTLFLLSKFILIFSH